MGDRLWDELPKWFDQDTIEARKRERDSLIAFTNSVKVRSERELAFRRVLQERIPFRLLPDPPEPLDVPIHEIPTDVEYVPVRIDIELEGVKLSDTLLINSHAAQLEARLAAQSMQHDFNLSPAFSSPIIATIMEQVSDYEHVMAMEGRMRRERPDLYGQLRVPIRLDITVGLLQVVDKFEWALERELVTPEELAQRYVVELSLPSEFKTAVAHVVREQVLSFKKSLLMSGMLLDLHDKPATEARRLLMSVDPDLATLLIIPDLTRPSTIKREASRLNEWTPVLTELHAGELGRLEAARDRDARRIRRQEASAAGGRGRKKARVEAKQPAEPVIKRIWGLRSPPRTLRTPADWKAEAIPSPSETPIEVAAPMGRRRHSRKQ